MKILSESWTRGYEDAKMTFPQYPQRPPGRAPELWSCKLVNWVNYDTSQPQIINSLTEKLEKELLQEFSSYLHKLLIILSGKCPISKFKSDSFDWKNSSLNIWHIDDKHIASHCSYLLFILFISCFAVFPTNA